MAWFDCDLHGVITHGAVPSVLEWSSHILDCDYTQKEAISPISKVAFVLFCWFIWKARDEFIFRNESISLESTVSKILCPRLEFS